MSLANVTVNTAPVSTEELLTKSSAKSSLSPEDDTVFIEKNTSQLGYERVWELKANFNIESNGLMNSIEIQNDAYGLRADTSYMLMVFEITLDGTTDDCAAPANMFPFVALKTLRMRLGLNQAEVIAPNEHYMYKFLNIMNSNYSKEDQINILSLFKCYPFMDMTQKKNRILMASHCGFTFTKKETIVRKVPFLIPLSVLHQMFNHRTIIPVGTRFDINFSVEDSGSTSSTCSNNAIVFGGNAADLKGSFKFIPSESYIYCQLPERDPSILLAQTENREYISEGLNYETYRIEIPKGTTYFNVPIIRPGSKLPVKIDFGLVDAANLNVNKDVFQFQGFGLNRVEVNYNGPFPHKHVLQTLHSKGLQDWPADGIPQDEAVLDRLPMFFELYNQTDTLLLDKFGESYNNETTYPPIKRVHPFLGYAAENPLLTLDADTKATLISLFNKRNVLTVILNPSKIFDGSAYPTVEGSLDIQLTFCKPTEQTIVMFLNCNYFQQLVLTQDYTCQINNITLDNFTGARSEKSGEDFSDAFPTGEEENQS